jgi:hypothetical protein
LTFDARPASVHSSDRPDAIGYAMHRRLSVLLVAVPLAIGAGVVIGRTVAPASASTDTTPAPPTPLTVPADKLNVGEVWETKDAKFPLPITNTTDRTLEIQDFESSCDCGEIVPRRLTLPPGGTATVTVTFDLLPRNNRQLGMARRQFSTTLKPILASREKVEPLTIQGVAKSWVTLNYMHVHFGDANVAGRPPVSRKVIATTYVDIDGISATVDNDSISATVTKLPDADKFQLLLTPNTTKQPGPFAATVTLRPVGVRAPPGVTLTLPVEGTLAQPEGK